MLKPIANNFIGLILITGPIKSGKSQLAEFLIKEQESITYIATSKPKYDDPEWELRINIHKRRRPESWKIVEYPPCICETIKSINETGSILIDSLGGLVEQHLMKDQDQWESIQTNFINCLKSSENAIIIVSEEIGWGIVPATPIGHLFRERLSSLSYSISRISTKKWLAVNGSAIDLDSFGFPIP